MGFTGKNTKKADGAARTTVVAAGTELVGDIKLKDNFHLDGKMDGSLVDTAEAAYNALQARERGQQQI